MMILQSIRLENWRCFVDSTEAGPFTEGLNVLHAPNATGKSTLFEALRRGLLDSHRVGGEEVKSLRPWGRELAPKVIVTFAHKGVDYRITKQFLEGATAVLERRENGRFTRLAENAAADDQVRVILSGNAPGRGLADYRNWGLAQILWAPQERLALEGLTDDVAAGIRNSLGVQLAGTGTGKIEQRINEVYSQSFTSSGKLKTGKDAPPLIKNRSDLQAATDRYKTALEHYQSLEQSARRLEDLRSRRAQSRRDAEAFTKELREARARLEKWRDLQSRRGQRVEQAKSAESEYNNLKRQIDGILSARAELAQCRESLKKLENDLPLHAKEVAAREKQCEEAKAAVEDVRKRRDEVEKAKTETEDARRFVAARERRREITSRLDRIAIATENAARRRRERSEVVAPDAKSLRAIRTAITKRDTAQIQIDGALITLEIVPKRGLDLTLLSGEESGAQTIQAGATARIKGSPEVVVDLDKIARIRATGPTGSIEDHRSEKAKAEKQIRELVQGYGTAEIDQLEILSERAAQLDKSIAEAEAELNTLLAGQGAEEIEQERARADAVLCEILAAHPDWENAPPDAEKLSAVAAEINKSFIADIDGAEARHDAARTALTAALEQRGAVDGRLKAVAQHAAQIEARVAELTRDGKPDAERETACNRALMAWDVSRAVLDEIDKEIAALGEDPGPIVTKIEKQLEAAELAATQALGQEKSEEGRLEQMAAQGPYSALAAAEEEVNRLKEAVSRDELALKAVRLLTMTVNQCRTRAMEAVAGPVEAAATRTLLRIAGPRLGSVKLGRAFEPAGVRPELAAEGVSLDSISGGEREQIHLATRLALAEVLSKTERQMVVLDDVLTATDTGRLARIMTILEESAERMQILILTCHPERYRGLERANFVDLEAIRMGTR